MKKTYFAPETTVVKIGLQQMIAASEVIDLNNNSGEALTEETNVASHSSSIWDDDEF